VRYCNKECQIKVYKEHKKKCTDWLLKELDKRGEKRNSLVRQHNACIEELNSKRATDATEKRLGDLIQELAEISEALATDNIKTGALILQNVKNKKVNESDEMGAYSKAWELLKFGHKHADHFQRLCGRLYEECRGTYLAPKLERGTGNRTLEADETEERIANLFQVWAKASEALARDCVQTGALMWKKVKDVSGGWKLLVLAQEVSEMLYETQWPDEGRLSPRMIEFDPFLPTEMHIESGDLLLHVKQHSAAADEYKDAYHTVNRPHIYQADEMEYSISSAMDTLSTRWIH
jgi:hypothetical protein